MPPVKAVKPGVINLNRNDTLPSQNTTSNHLCPHGNFFFFLKRKEKKRKKP
jgi:hypothetical protein